LELNPEQRAAVEHGKGPLLIIAGPGSGKTRVITGRIVHLLGGQAGSGRERQNGGQSEAVVRPESILALTYTDKAAGEMQQRVREALPDLETHPTICTFHAFCKQVLDEQNFDQQLLEPVDLWIFLRRRMRELALKHYRKLAEPGAFLHDLNEFFSRCQDELVEPDDFAAYVAKLRAALGSDSANSLDVLEVDKKEELARVFRRSRELLEAAGCTSFGSLISETLRLWAREPHILARYRDRFHYVLVDEFQDSNYAQVEILKRLVAPPYNITAVGDDDQAIYRFRGASHGTFEMFDRAFPGHHTVYLNRNYRSTKRILRASQAVIGRNEGRYPWKPELQTENGEGPKVHLLESPDDRSEAAWVAGEVERLAKRGSGIGDIAVLYRSHRHRDRLVAEFRRRGIPFTIRGLSILRTPMVRDLVAYLHLIHFPHHNISLTRVLLAPRWRFPEELARDGRRRASVNRCSLYAAIRSMEQTLFAADLRRTGWDELETLLGGLRELARVAPVTALFDRLVDGLGLDSLDRGRDRDYIESFRKFLQEWEKKNETGNLELPEGAGSEPRTALGNFMEYFPYFQEAGGQIEAPDPLDTSRAVQMMTVHAAKGLEFPVVFVLSVGRQRFPTTERKPVIEFPDALRKGPPAPPGIHLQEERRLFYVALTRARERLYVSSLGRPGAKPSAFIQDLLSNPAVRVRDIEPIQGPAVADERAPVRLLREVAGNTDSDAPPGRILLSERTVDESSQGRLFPDDGDIVSLLHPNLEEWARRPVRSGQENGQPLVLSATSIETYRNCPLRFKFQHLLKIQTEPQASLTFGAVMHQSVRHYFKLRGAGGTRFEDLKQFFLSAWKDTGFQDGYHAEQYQQEGLEELREFVERLNAQPAPSHLVSEQSFSLDVHGVRVQGRIDQVQAATPGAPPQGARLDHALLDDGNAALGAGTEASLPPGLDVELIDYKTGRPKSQQDADKSLQLSVYALAAERALGLRPLRLTFYNLSNNQAVSTVRNEQDLDELVREIRQVAEAIRQEEFAPTPGYVCRRCEYTAICPAQEEV
jgi:ATP-dependent DNA helicase UvrD/PcrA